MKQFLASRIYQWHRVQSQHKMFSHLRQLRIVVDSSAAEGPLDQVLAADWIHFTLIPSNLSNNR